MTGVRQKAENNAGPALALMNFGRNSQVAIWQVRQSQPRFRAFTSGPRLPPSAGPWYLGTLNSICLFIFQLASATVGRARYLGTLNSICLFIFLASDTRTSSPGALDSVNLFSSQLRWPPSARVCYLGTLYSICLFSFQLAPSSAGICYLGALKQHLPVQLTTYVCPRSPRRISFSPGLGCFGPCYLGLLESVGLFSNFSVLCVCLPGSGFIRQGLR